MNRSSLNKREILYNIEPEASFDILMICPVPIIKLKHSWDSMYAYILIIIKNAQFLCQCVHFTSMLYAVCRVVDYNIIIILNARSLKWHPHLKVNNIERMNEWTKYLFNLSNQTNAKCEYDCEKSTMWMTSNRQLEMFK